MDCEYVRTTITPGGPWIAQHLLPDGIDADELSGCDEDEVLDCYEALATEALRTVAPCASYHRAVSGITVCPGHASDLVDHLDEVLDIYEQLAQRLTDHHNMTDRWEISGWDHTVVRPNDAGSTPKVR